MLASFALTLFVLASTAMAEDLCDPTDGPWITEYSAPDVGEIPFAMYMNLTQKAAQTWIDSGGYNYTVPIIENYTLHITSYEQIAQGIWDNAQNGSCDASYLRFNNKTDDTGGDPNNPHHWEAVWYSNRTYDVHPNETFGINPFGDYPCQNMGFNFTAINQTVFDCINRLNLCGCTHGCCTMFYVGNTTNGFTANHGQWNVKLKITANPAAHPADSLKCADEVDQTWDR